jgi:hypothetical protein
MSVANPIEVKLQSSNDLLNEKRILAENEET